MEAGYIASTGSISKEKEILVEKNSKYRLVLFGIILILSLGFLIAYFISRKVYVEKQFIISEQREKIARVF